MNSADLCRASGWTAGTRLSGNEGHWVAVIELTAIGEEVVLAKTVSLNGKPAPDPDEACWSLMEREWVEVSE